MPCNQSLILTVTREGTQPSLDQPLQPAGQVSPTECFSIPNGAHLSTGQTRLSPLLDRRPHSKLRGAPHTWRRTDDPTLMTPVSCAPFWSVVWPTPCSGQWEGGEKRKKGASMVATWDLLACWRPSPKEGAPRPNRFPRQASPPFPFPSPPSRSLSRQAFALISTPYGPTVFGNVLHCD